MKGLKMEDIAMDSRKAKEIIDELRANDVLSDYDLCNLEFLLTASLEVLMDWHLHIEADDLDYARELLATVREYFTQDAAELDVTQANQVLKKFML